MIDIENTNMEEKPACYGDMETVFPKKEDGLRHSPEKCMACLHKTDCMREALSGASGLGVQEEKLDRAYKSGTVSFLERWSKKKRLYNKKKRPQKDIKS